MDPNRLLVEQARDPGHRLEVLAAPNPLGARQDERNAMIMLEAL
jgi:hypothetical protein